MQLKDFGSIASNLGGFLGDYGVPIYIGSQIASTYLRKKANDAVNARLQQQAEAERARQAAIGAQARAKFDATLPQFTPQATGATQDAQQQKIEQAAAAATPQNQALLTYQGNASQPQVVKDSIAGRFAEASAKGADYATRAARMHAVQQGLNLNDLTLNDTNQTLARLGNDATRSANILPLEMDQTRLYTGRDARLASDIIGGAGNIAGMYAITHRKPRMPAPGPNGTGPNGEYVPLFGNM